jgi:PAS domain S-box-containing protein
LERGGMNRPDSQTTAVVVNDDPTQLELLSGLLKKTGLEVHAFAGADEALAAMDPARPPAIIVTDLYMPGIDGWRFCRLLRLPEYAAFNRVPVLVVSATFAGDEPERIAENLGASGFVPAPVNGAQFIERVRAIVSGARVPVARRVLLVEADARLSGQLGDTFTHQGYQVDAVSTVSDAAGAFAAQTYALAIIEYHLSDGSGDALLDALRRQQPECVCIMMTSDPDPQLAVDWMKRGAAAYLQKPFHPDYLIELCDRACRERALLRARDLLEMRTRELRESEEKYRLLVENQNELVIQFDPDMHILFVNPAYCATFGKTGEALLGKSFFPLVHEQDQACVEASLKKVLQPPHVTQHHERALTGRGWRWFAWSAKAVLSSEGNISSIISVGRDITERKQAEEALAKSRTELQAIYDNAPVMICLLDEDRRVLYVNPAVTAFIEASEEELQAGYACGIFGCVNALDDQRGCGFGRHCKDCVLRAALEDTLETGVGHPNIEHRMSLVREGVCRDVTLLVSTALIRISEGCSILLCLQDISDRKQIEEQTKLQALVLDQIKDHVTITDLNGVITYVNQVQIETFGWSWRELIGHTTDIYGENTAQGAGQREILETTLREGSWRGAVTNYAADGSTIIMDCRTQVIHDGAGKPIVLCGIATDITERTRMQERLQKMVEMLNNAPNSICIHDTEGRFIYANEMTFAMHGYSAQEFMNLNLEELDVPESVALQQQRYRLIAEKGAASFEVAHFRKDRSIVPLEVFAKMVTWDGKPAILSIATDITERKKTDELLRRSEERFRQAMQATKDGLWDWDNSTGESYYSPGCYRMLGFEPGEFHDAYAWVDRIHPDDRERAFYHLL